MKQHIDNLRMLMKTGNEYDPDILSRCRASLAQFDLYADLMPDIDAKTDRIAFEIMPWAHNDDTCPATEFNETNAAPMPFLNQWETVFKKYTGKTPYEWSEAGGCDVYTLLGGVTGITPQDARQICPDVLTARQKLITLMQAWERSQIEAYTNLVRYHNAMQHRFEAILDYATGGALSCSGYSLQTIKQKIDEHRRAQNELLPTVWIMLTANGWYSIQPSAKCKPEDHGRLNAHVQSIEDAQGNVLWERKTDQGAKS